MKERRPRIVPVFELTLLVALGLIGGVAFLIFRMTSEPGDWQLGMLRNEFFRVSDYIQRGVPDLGTAYKAATSGSDGKGREDFDRRNEMWREWISREQRVWGE